MDPVAKRLQRDALDVRENGTVTGKTFASLAVMQTLCWTVFVKRELSLWFYLLICLPTLTFVHKLSGMTESIILWI